MLAFERLAEEKIRDAIAAGEFEQLPGKGKPLPLDDYFSVRPEERMAYAVLKNSGFLPEHLQLRKELEICLNELEQFLNHCRQRLGKWPADGHSNETNPSAPAQSLKNPRPGFRLKCIFSKKLREQNSALESGKRVGSAAAWVRRRAYLYDRQWLRHRLGELASRAGETAQRLHDALVEKEIRDQRPLTFLLGSPFISVENILMQFDREFPQPG